jgi:hypothetical protein
VVWTFGESFGWILGWGLNGMGGELWELRMIVVEKNYCEAQRRRQPSLGINQEFAIFQVLNNTVPYLNKVVVLEFFWIKV